jgi:hypothetical protein
MANKRMTERKWLASTHSAAMLNFLRGKASDRKLRLFAVADLPPFYVPVAVRVGSTVTDVSSGRRSAAESGRGHISPYSAGVRYPSEL